MMQIVKQPFLREISQKFTLGQSTRVQPEGRPQHLDFVDALRGWAFLGVLLVHTSSTVTGLPELLRELALKGQYGVQLFFVISAFTLFLSYNWRFHEDHRPILAFFVRRFFRVAPLFYVGILFYLWWYGTGSRFYAPEGLGWFEKLSTTLFLHGWYPYSINSVVPGGWSIAVEMFFYLLVPICFRLVHSMQRALGFFLVSLLSLGLLGKLQIAQRLFPNLDSAIVSEFAYQWLPNQLPVFCLGFVLYFLIKADETANSQGGRFRTGCSLVTLAAVTICLGNTWLLPQHVMMAICFCLVSWGLSKYPTPLLVNSLTQYIGKVSFSAYIVHFFVLDVVRLFFGTIPEYVRFEPLIAQVWIHRPIIPLSEWPSLLQFILVLVIALATTIGVATFTHHFVEVPGQRLGKWLIKTMN